MIRLTTEKEQDLKSKMIEVFKMNSRYVYISDDSLNTYLSKWKKNKSKIYNFLSQQEDWNEDELCLVVKKKIQREENKSQTQNIAEKICERIFGRRERLSYLLHNLNYNSSHLLDCKPKHTKEQVEAWSTSSVRELLHWDYWSDSSLYSYLFYKCHLSLGMKKSKVFLKLIDFMAKYHEVEYEKLTYTLNEFCKVRDEDGGFRSTHIHSREQTKAKLCDYLTPLETDETFYISINPLDYLTMSHGDGWDSCHSLKNNGCYHAATLTTLADPSTVIVYTLSESKAPTKDFYSINKKTRQMLFLSNNLDAIFQQVFYPSRSTNDNLVVREVLQELLSKYLDVENAWENVSDYHDASITTKEYLGYKDWSCGKPYHIYKLAESNLKFSIGRKVPYIDDNSEYIRGNGDMIRRRYSTCKHCGKVEAVDDLKLIDGCYYCEKCADEMFYKCESCGKYHHIDSTKYIDEKYYCEKCAKKINYVTTENGLNVTEYVTLKLESGNKYYSSEELLLQANPEAKKCDVCGVYFIDECLECKEREILNNNISILLKILNNLDETSKYHSMKDKFIEILNSPTSIANDIKELILSSDLSKYGGE